MNYTILYHPRVEEDASLINKNIRIRLGRAVRERLSARPEAYGKPLRGSLAGYWSLRVGDYRAVFKIKGDEVWVFGVIDRRDVYENVVKRLSWRP
ncbi:MAG: type II toxin-antitoxin system RelE/ParE family toxin [Elusimicrobiota bacterium]